MKTSVRFLSMLLAVLMIAGAALTASADVAEEAANNEALQLLVDLGIFGGYDDGSLKPQQLVERDEMAKIIFVLYTTFSDAGEGAVSFKDVAADNWAAGYISWCSSRGIVGGYGDGNFGPDNHVTYDQALKMVCGALGYNDWDSKFWPTDVRTKALRDLNLGKNLTDVAGSQEITRAQVAQIVYNALFAPMNEMRSEQTELGGLTIYLPVPKTLAEDVWKFEKKSFTITGVTGFGKATVSEDYDIYVDGLGEFTLEELGLEAYASNLDDLFMADISFFYDSNKVENVADISSDNILAASVNVNAVKDVELTYDDKKDIIYIGEEKADEGAVIYSCDADGKVTETTLAKEDAPEEEALYTSVAYDLDRDGLYDAYYLEYLKPYKVGTITKKSVSMNVYGQPSNIITKDVEKIVVSGELEEDDVIVAVPFYGKLVVKQIVEPISDRASAFAPNKLTLDETGEVVINKQVFTGVLSDEVFLDTVMALDDKGETPLYDYYIYEGKVFGTNATASESDLRFAILSYINDPVKGVFNEITMDEDTFYTAELTIDGKSMTVDLNPENTLNNKGIKDNEAEILNKYGKVYIDDNSDEPLPYGTKGKYVYNHYALVTYTVDEDGYYSLSTEATSEDFTVYEGVTLSYDKKSGLYVLTDSTTSDVVNNTVVLDDAILYYSYAEKATGKFSYLGSYTAETLPENFASVEIEGKVYLTTEEETEFLKLQVAVIDDETVEFAKDNTADYRTDSRLLYYCYEYSDESLTEDGEDSNYSYYMKPIYNGTNLSETINKERTKDAGATLGDRGTIYAWDEDAKNYVAITNSTIAESLADNDENDPATLENDITCIGMYKIEKIVNGCIITEAGSKYANGVAIPADASIWAVNINTYSGYVTYTIDTLKDLVKLGDELEKDTRVIIGTYINENGEEVVSTVIVEIHTVNSTTGKYQGNAVAFSRFGG